MPATESPPVYRAEPTGPQVRLLRKIAAGAKLTATRTITKQLLCLIDGQEVASGTVAGLLTRGLIEEQATGDESSVYELTPEGRKWAKGNK